MPVDFLGDELGGDCLGGGKMRASRLPQQVPVLWFQLAPMPPEPAAAGAVVTWVSDPSEPTW